MHNLELYSCLYTFFFQLPNFDNFWVAKAALEFLGLLTVWTPGGPVSCG